jgi:ABC-2 type transport system permease protein
MFRKIFIIIEKEFKQIFRNKLMIGIIFGMPIIQLLILSYTIDYEVKNVKVFIDDQDKSHISTSLINKINNSSYFEILGYGSYSQGLKMIEENKNELIISFPENFEKDFYKPGADKKLNIAIDAINGMKAGVSLNYSINVINDFVKSTFAEELGVEIKNPVNIVSRNWFNEQLDYKILMVPGILVLLVTMISLFLSSMNIVIEKEIGTIEQINVTPIKKIEFILGKILPFVLIGLSEFTIGLTIAYLWFSVPIQGSLVLIYLFTFVYLTLVLGIGVLISNFSDTQQQAMFVAWFFAVIFILMSGLFTPIESMPEWAQKITYFNPIKYYIEVLRLVLLKGSEFKDVSVQFISIIVYSAVINFIAIRFYSKTNS